MEVVRNTRANKNMDSYSLSLAFSRLSSGGSTFSRVSSCDSIGSLQNYSEYFFLTPTRGPTHMTLAAFSRWISAERVRFDPTIDADASQRKPSSSSGCSTPSRTQKAGTRKDACLTGRQMSRTAGLEFFASPNHTVQGSTSSAAGQDNTSPVLAHRGPVRAISAEGRAVAGIPLNPVSIHIARWCQLQ